MSGLLESMARRLAGDHQIVSRRELILGPRRTRAANVDRQPLAGASHDVRRPAPAAADLRTMRTAVAQAAPSRPELLALIAALKEPRPDGRFNDSAFNDITRLRSKLHTAHARVAEIRHDSGVRANLLDYLADVDAMLANLAALGQNINPVRAGRLRIQNTELDQHAKAAYQKILPALNNNDTLKAGKP
jgi:hypothetical protein